MEMTMRSSICTCAVKIKVTQVWSPLRFIFHIYFHLLCPNCHSFISCQLFPSFIAASVTELCHILSAGERAYLNTSKDRFKTCQLAQAAHHHPPPVSAREAGTFVCRSPPPLRRHVICTRSVTTSLSYPADFIFPNTRSLFILKLQFYYDVCTGFGCKFVWNKCQI